MRKMTPWLTAVLGLAGGVVAGAWLTSGPPSLAAPTKPEPDKRPRFTESREAAALHFVKKHLPEMLPVLTQLKKTSKEQYRREIREIFHDTEVLAGFSDDRRRYALELNIWKTENRANLLLAKLAAPKKAERKKVQDQVYGLAKELVSLDPAILELKEDKLDRELGKVQDEMARISENKEKVQKERFKSLLQKAGKPPKEKEGARGSGG